MTSPVEESFTDTSNSGTIMSPLRRTLLIGGIGGLGVLTLKFVLTIFASAEGMVYLGPTWFATMTFGIALRLPTEGDLRDTKSLTECRSVARTLLWGAWPMIVVLGWMSCWHKPAWPNFLDLGFSLIFISLMTSQMRRLLAEVAQR